MKSIIPLLASILSMSALSAQAEVLVHYDNPIKNASSLNFDSGVPHLPTYSAPLVTASAITNTGVQGINHIESYQTNGWSSTGSPDPTKYIVFSITPEAGYELRFDSFSIDLWQSLGGDGTRRFSLRSNADAFDEDIFSGIIDRVTANPTNSTYSFSLATLLPRTTATEFRLYFYDVATSGRNFSLISMGSMGNGIYVSGSVTPVPVPSASVLSASGLALLAFLSRRPMRPKVSRQVA